MGACKEVKAILRIAYTKKALTIMQRGNQDGKMLSLNDAPVWLNMNLTFYLGNSEFFCSFWETVEQVFEIL